jgi:hypothetical protein
MADKTAPIVHDPSAAEAPVATFPETALDTTPRARRTVTMPVLPLAIVGGVIVALIFFGGGIAVGVAIGDHPSRAGIIQPFDGRNGFPGGQNGNGPNGGGPNGQNGFGQNGDGRNGGQPGGQNGGTRPNDRPTTAPKNG